VRIVKFFENMIIRLQQTNSKQHFISDILITSFLPDGERKRAGQGRGIKDVAQSMFSNFVAQTNGYVCVYVYMISLKGLEMYESADASPHLFMF
jgi:hypothetical protein